MVVTSNEILEIACQIEHNGVAFYHRAAELAQKAQQRKLLMRLADMEAEHEVLFRQLQSDLPAEERAGSDLDEDDGAWQFLQALAGGHVFDMDRDVGDILTGEESMDEILSVAIGLEKESIVYHSALKEVVENEPSKRKIQQVLLEEMRHIALLSGQRAKLKE